MVLSRLQFWDERFLPVCFCGFEAGFAYMANDNATACLLWQAMVKGCFVVWKAVGNHTSNFASHPFNLRPVQGDGCESITDETLCVGHFVWE